MREMKTNWRATLVPGFCECCGRKTNTGGTCAICYSWTYDQDRSRKCNVHPPDTRHINHTGADLPDLPNT